MRFWKLSSLPDLDDMAPTPLEKRPPRPGELLLAAGAAFFAAGLEATFLAAFLTAFGAALPLGAATAFGADFLPPPNMAGSAERTAVRVTTAEAGATKASVHAKRAARAKSLYNMLELRKGGPLVSQGRTDAATWLFLCTVGEIGCFYRDG